MATRGNDDRLEDVFLTLYTSGMDAKILNSEGPKRIARAIARLDKDKRKAVEDEAAYRLERWRAYHAAAPGVRAETTQLERETGLNREEAFERVRKRRAA